MNLVSHLLQRALHLDPPLTRDLVVQRGLKVPMPDGVELLADRWAPRSATGPLPTALLRTPYGRGLMSTWMARPLAERGFQVLVQSVRGTFGSGGAFDPMRQEQADGLATLAWVKAQPWFGGTIVLTGLSYLGYVQWAIADRLPPEVVGLVPMVTESALTLEFLRPDGLSLETPFGWGVLIDGQEQRGALLRQRPRARRAARALSTLPLGRADAAAVGHRSDYIQDIIAFDATSPRWAGIDHRAAVPSVTVPVSSIAGWYDIFLPGQLRDFQALQAAGRRARLTVGPWTHLSLSEMGRTWVAETLALGLAGAGLEPRGGAPAPERAPVRLYVTGEEAWHDFEAWPPPGFAPRRLYLQPGRGLSAEPPAGASAPERFRYDPADPTPAVGGIRMSREAGPKDNTALEARADVVTFTTAPLEHPLDVIGEVSAEIWFQSSLAFADVFVRLCDVHPDGRSLNVCDGLTSLSGADALACRTVQLWPTAHRFRAGHRIRLQVSSGAFPRYARNHGTGEPRAAAVELRAAEQAVYLGAGHPSALVLPAQRDGR